MLKHFDVSASQPANVPVSLVSVHGGLQIDPKMLLLDLAPIRKKLQPLIG